MDFCHRVSADGNCLYNAVSIGLVGNEDLSLILRLLTSIELFEHYKHYQMSVQKTIINHSFSNDLSAIKQLFHFESVENLTDINELVKSIETETLLNCEISKFCSMICILGLASVIEQPISSIYSPRKNIKTFQLFTRILEPRLPTAKNPLTLLLSTTASNTSNNPNHFVLCTDRKLTKSITTFTTISSLAKSIKTEPLKRSQPKIQTTIPFLKRNSQNTHNSKYVVPITTIPYTSTSSTSIVTSSSSIQTACSSNMCESQPNNSTSSKLTEQPVAKRNRKSVSRTVLHRKASSAW